MSPLQARKQLLIAESDVNRSQLSREWQTMVHGVHDLRRQFTTFGTLASTAASLVGGLAALRRGRPAPRTTRPSWINILSSCARVATTLLYAVRPGSQNGKPR